MRLGRRLNRALVFGFLVISFTIAAPIPHGVAQQADDERTRLARLQAQIIELEEQIRRLTGRLEEAEFRQRTTDGRLERLVGDIDVRLRGLETVNPGRSVAPLDDTTPQPGDQATPIEPTITPINPTTPPAPQPSQSTDNVTIAGEGVLGTIPRDALLGLERPGQGGVAPAATAVVRGDAATRFGAIQGLLAESDIASARPALQDFLRDFPQADETSRAAYLLGETWFLDTQYADAAAQFAENYRIYGASDAQAADNLLKLGMSLARLGDAERACTAMLEFERRYPQVNIAMQQMAQRERRAAGCQ